MHERIVWRHRSQDIRYQRGVTLALYLRHSLTLTYRVVSIYVWQNHVIFTQYLCNIKITHRNYSVNILGTIRYLSFRFVPWFSGIRDSCLANSVVHLHNYGHPCLAAHLGFVCLGLVERPSRRHRRRRFRGGTYLRAYRLGIDLLLLVRHVVHTVQHPVCLRRRNLSPHESSLSLEL